MTHLRCNLTKTDKLIEVISQYILMIESALRNQDNKSLLKGFSIWYNLSRCDILPYIFYVEITPSKSFLKPKLMIVSKQSRQRS